MIIAIFLFATSCAPLRATNVPLEQVDPGHGYHQGVVMNRNGMGDIFLLLAFSGGGTRAAALSYGVLQELRDTSVTVEGEKKRLLDEIDLITSVSGGSFTSAYYGLHGDRTFEDYESRFLKRSVSRDILFRALWPHNLVRLLFPFYDRTDLTVDYYDAKVFDGARFSDLLEANGPMIQINSTDISIGAPFTFTQRHFDAICSDLSQLKVSRAVTASSAVPVVFPTIVLRNLAGSCGFEEPPWIQEALSERADSARRFNIARERHSYLDRSKKPYIHLVDGGIADNLGVRGPLDEALVSGGLADRLRILGIAPPKHLAFIIVDASTNTSASYVFSASPPSLGDVLNSVTDTQLHRYNFETVELLERSMEEWAGELSAEGQSVDPHVIEVAEYEILDPETRAYFNAIPTSLGLSEEEVDRLIAIGRQLLRESEPFQEFVRSLQEDS